MSKKIIEKDLEGVVESLGIDDLTDEEKQELLDDAINEFNNIPGIEFDEVTDDDELNLKNDFNKKRRILINNINRLEKLTTICINNVALDNNNIGMLQTSLGVISEQSKALKLLSELQGKLFTNKHLSQKANGIEQGANKPNNSLPPGWEVK